MRDRSRAGQERRRDARTSSRSAPGSSSTPGSRSSAAARKDGDEGQAGDRTAAEVITACLSATPSARLRLRAARDPKGRDREEEATKLANAVTDKCVGDGVDLATGGVPACAPRAAYRATSRSACKISPSAAPVRRQRPPKGCSPSAATWSTTACSTTAAPSWSTPTSATRSTTSSACCPTRRRASWSPTAQHRRPACASTSAANGMPHVNGPAGLPPALNQLDGFSPTAQILMHFPQGVDLELSDAARLLGAGVLRAAGRPAVDRHPHLRPTVARQRQPDAC